MQHLLNIVPFVSGLVQKNIFDYDKKFDGSANFITYLIQGEKPRYGDGTSVVADLYLDFGPYLTFIAFIIIDDYFSLAV